jgi:predicted dithiol-disulfide oxidoreductase (DUF899 family)
MTEQKVATREQWQAARRELLELEKEHAERARELTRRRQELPWVAVEREYTFETDEGTKTLAELFEVRSQLLAYHLRFGPDYTGACPGCSDLADHLDGGVVHLNHRDVSFMCISRDPLDKLQAYKRRMGWTFPWVSSFGSDFSRVAFTPEQIAGGVEHNYQLLDLVPSGRGNEFRVTRHDEYDDAS